tara:strand:- start:1031 stop:1237 length:207 start_codon:yes stop_codon:yes gene_type:complete
VSHTITDVAKLTVGVVNTDINSIATTLQTAMRSGGSLGFVNSDKIIEIIITRRDANNNCQVIVVWEDQ